MALARVKVWVAEVLTFGDLNAEFNNILNNPVSLISPLTGAINLNGFTLTLDAAGVSTLVSSASQYLQLTPGAKTGTPGTTGSLINVVASTYTDNATAASGTAAQFAAHAIQRPTLAATNTGVTTTDAATVYIANSPLAGTNETLTNSWALQVAAGNTKLAGHLYFTDATYDIGGTATTFRPRDIFNSRDIQVGRSVGIGVAPSGTAGRLTVNENLIVSGVGPHAIGGATSADVQLSLLGAFTGTTVNVFGINQSSTLTPPVNGLAIGVRLQPTLNKASSGTHADFVTMQLDAPTIGAGAATLTNATTLKITGAPSVGTNQYALWSAGVNAVSRFDGPIVLKSTTVAPTGGGPAVWGDTSAGFLAFEGGATATVWYNQNISAERMRLTDAGILAVGTTVTTTAAAGDIIVNRGQGLRSVNVAATATKNLITLSGADQVLISGDNLDIQWGKPLVALGGGAAPTFGTIGGSGPATAAQNSWMRAIDNTGAAFWVPVWK